MKKIFFAITSLVAFSISSFAGGKDVDRKLLRDLTTTLTSSTQVHWANKDNYTSATFAFNGKTASAFYNVNDGDLLGFAIKFDRADLPDVVSKAIADKYSDWELKDAIVFIDTDGHINYYAEVQKNNKALALQITPGGNLSTYARYAPGK